MCSGRRKVQGLGIVGRSSVGGEGFVHIKDRNKLNGGGDAPKGMKKGWGRAMFLRRFEDIVRDMKGVVEVDCKDPQMEVGDMKGGRGNEDFGWLHVGEGFKRVFVVEGVRKELHMLLTPIHKGRVAWSVRVRRCRSNLHDIGEDRSGDRVMRGEGDTARGSGEVNKMMGGRQLRHLGPEVMEKVM
jgi:hypothetical protein